MSIPTFPNPATATPHHAALLYTTSASILAYEILLMRLLAIGQWHHFAYMVISIALLGYGAAGSLLFLFFRGIARHLDRWLVILAGTTAVSFPLSFSLSQKVGLDPLQLVWQPAQWLAMLATYLLMGLPFLLGGGIVGIILTGSREKAHRMYAADLLGAGSGAVAVVPALFLGPPWRLLPATGCLVLLGAFCCAIRMTRRWLGMVTLLTALGVVAASYILFPPIPKIHHTKALPKIMSFPDAKIEATFVGPVGLGQVIGSSLIREAPGLSLNFGLHGDEAELRLPEQKEIFLDAEALGPITRFSGNPDETAFLDFTTISLPYHIRQPSKVVIVGAGGGSDVLLALRHHCAEVTAIEANKQIAGLLQGPFSGFSGGIYSRPEVRLEIRDARQFLQSTKARFDLINLSLLDSPVTSVGGLHSAAETYLYTTEAFSSYLSHLTDSGMLAVTRWLKLPPRDSLRVVTTALTALRQKPPRGKAEKHLLVIRSWRTVTILVSKSPFSSEEIKRATTFCDERSFDLVYYAGMPVERANRYDIQESPSYFEGVTALVGPDAESFIHRYVFDVRATSDDRPYFFHFFRWDKAPELFRQLKREWLPMVELGFIFILATLVQAIVASGLLILLPLVLLGWIRGSSRPADTRYRLFDILTIGAYFAAIGTAFMFLEMALLPKFTLFLSHPVYSAAVVLGVLLVFAGAGSMSVRRFQEKGSRFLWVSVAVILFWVGFQTIAGDRLFNLAMSWSLGTRFALAGLFLCVLSFFLGWPFPSGLRILSEKHPDLVPWAWGINGCASVIGAVLGKCLAISIGFRFLMGIACLLYLLALITYHFAFNMKPSLPRIPLSAIGE